MADVALQVDRIAPDATHFVVSVGGNDALDQLGVLQDRTNSIAAALNRLATRSSRCKLARGFPCFECAL
jgi:hypothetical protein